MIKVKMSILVSIFTIATLTGCGSSSTTTKSGWNGAFVDTGVQGIGWKCGTVSGLTLVDGLFGTCPAGSSVTFSIGSIELGSIDETDDHIFTPQDLVGASRTVTENTQDQNDQVNAIAAILLTLDNDGDPSNGIMVEPTAATAFETATTSNGGTIAPTNVESITAGIVATVTTLTAVTTTAAATHLVATGIEIANGTIASPDQNELTGATINN